MTNTNNVSEIIKFEEFEELNGKRVNSLATLVGDSDEVRVVVHDGMYHADELMAIAMINTITHKKKKIKVIRTRDISVVQDGDIVLDVFHTKLDHHDPKKQVQEDGRILAAAGLTWRWLKPLFLPVIGEEGWSRIDQSLVLPVDHTDNTGEMNPFTYSVNAVRGSVGMDGFSTCLEMVTLPLQAAVLNELKMFEEQQEYKACQQFTVINGKKLRVLDKHLGIFEPADDEAGYIWPENNGYTIKMFTAFGHKLDKCGVKVGEIPGVLFTHPNGFLGKVNSMEDLDKIV